MVEHGSSFDESFEHYHTLNDPRLLQPMKYGDVPTTASEQLKNSIAAQAGRVSLLDTADIYRISDGRTVSYIAQVPDAIVDGVTVHSLYIADVEPDDVPIGTGVVKFPEQPARAFDYLTEPFEAHTHTEGDAYGDTEDFSGRGYDTRRAFVMNAASRWAFGKSLRSGIEHNPAVIQRWENFADRGVAEAFTDDNGSVAYRFID